MVGSQGTSEAPVRSGFGVAAEGAAGRVRRTIADLMESIKSRASGSSCRGGSARYPLFMHIPPPPIEFDVEDRILHCEQALEIAIQDIVSAAVAAGWHRDEVLAAITNLSDNLMLADSMDLTLNELLKTFRRPRR